MIELQDELYNDLQKVKQIPVVPVMLDVICQATGLGFAAIARVTENRWLACSVLDQVQFGLGEGGELKIETTLCDEIRDHRQPIVIDHVAEDEKYRDHHTPKTYGLQSYISFPIILKNGQFFGTLCAIGTEPAQLNNTKITGMFTLFAELLSFYLDSIEVLDKSHVALKETSKQLLHSTRENALYQQISSHHLQEPLRKIRIFSDILVNDTDNEDLAAAKKTARKLNTLTGELTNMISHLGDFSAITKGGERNEQVNLNEVLQDVMKKLLPKMEKYNTRVDLGKLPVIPAVASQMNQLFYNLLEHSIIFSGSSGTGIKVRMKEPIPGKKACDIFIEQDDAGAEAYYLDNIFDMFVHTYDGDNAEKYQAGLAICQKIVHNHDGELSAHSDKDTGVSFCISLPVDFARN